MTELGEDFRAFKAEAKIISDARIEREILELRQFCDVFEINVNAITDWQYRLTKSGSRPLDIYPKNRRYHDIGKNFRSRYRDLILFVELHFKLTNL